jgi:hypothetical protein
VFVEHRSSGEILDEFEVSHNPEGFRLFFSRIEKQRLEYDCPVAVAMEGFNGYARPLDTLVKGHVTLSDFPNNSGFSLPKMRKVNRSQIATGSKT